MMAHVKKTIHSNIINMYMDHNLVKQSDILFQFISSLGPNKVCDGFTLQIGWSVYRFDQTGSKQYVVSAPDYINGINGMNNKDLTLPLMVHSSQYLLLDSLNITDKAANVTFNDKIVLAKGVLDNKNIYLQRSSDVDKGDSGWYVGYVDDAIEESELYALYTYQLLSIRPELLQVLMLPPEYMVIVEGSDIKAILNENDENVL